MSPGSLVLRMSSLCRCMSDGNALLPNPRVVSMTVHFDSNQHSRKVTKVYKYQLKERSFPMTTFSHVDNCNVRPVRPILSPRHNLGTGGLRSGQQHLQTSVVYFFRPVVDFLFLQDCCAFPDREECIPVYMPNSDPHFLKAVQK